MNIDKKEILLLCFFKRKEKKNKQTVVEQPVGAKTNKINHFLSEDDEKISIQVKSSTNFNKYHVGVVTILKSDIIELSKETIKCYEVLRNENFIESSFDGYSLKLYSNLRHAIENKQDYIKSENKYIVTYGYEKNEIYWEKNAYREKIESKIVKKMTPKEVFTKVCESKYKLIETEEELDSYLNSKLSCDDWCRLKLYTKMRELGFGNGFIDSFADLIGNDLNKYHQMIDLASETNDRDTLMYLYTYKFGKKGDE